MSSESTRLEVSAEKAGLRLDVFLVENFPEYSRSKLRVAITQGQVLVDQKSAKPSFRLNENQVVDCKIEIEANPVPEPEEIPLEIIHDDDDFVVINKPPRMVVHPSKGHWSGTLTAALAFRFQELSSCGGQQRPGIVHRLDRDTSGVIVVAKNDNAHMNLAKQFENRTVKKEYFAVVSPLPDRERDWIDEPIGVHPYQREKMTIRANHPMSREAKTFYEVIDRFKPFPTSKPYGTLKLFPKTGRTHQIRVHLQHIGCPVVADKLYSGRSQLIRQDLLPHDNENLRQNPDNPSTCDEVIIDRQALHAHRLQFNHPVTGEELEFVAPIPEDIMKLIDAVKPQAN